LQTIVDVGNQPFAKCDHRRRLLIVFGMAESSFARRMFALPRKRTSKSRVWHKPVRVTTKFDAPLARISPWEFCVEFLDSAYPCSASSRRTKILFVIRGEQKKWATIIL
jgi:hypothetical protein